MKMKLVLVTISAAALAVSADCQAMMRRATVRVAAPKAQKEPRRPLSFSRNHENKLAMPMVADNRLNSEMITAISKHQELSNKRNQITAKIKADKKILALISSVVVPSFLMVSAVSGITLEAAPMLMVPSVRVLAYYRDMQVAFKQQKSVEQELTDLVVDQKRILRIPDDIQ